MALIEFLLKNWIFVLIALALLSQFRKKTSTRRDQSQRSEKSGMPAFGGNPTIPGSLAGKSVKPAAEKQQASSSGFNPPAKSPKGSLMDTGRTLMDSGTSSTLSKESMQTDDLYHDAYAEPVMTGTMQTSKQQLAQGIIWAEILGPPRAKKPFRRS